MQGAAPKVTHGDIFIAERFIGWQEKSLLALQQSFDSQTKVQQNFCQPLPCFP